MNNTYHVPVLLKESINALNILPSGVYVDATFGGGGHTKEILNHLNSSGKVIAFDQDADAYKNRIDDFRFELIAANFSHLKQYLKYYSVIEVDGILADFGVSSHQFNEGSRGFSIREEGRLDMRMNQSQDLDAYEVINQYSEEALSKLFFNYGEMRNSKKVAKLIVNTRIISDIKTTKDLIDLLKPLVPQRFKNSVLAKIFQAIRIEVNDELAVLKTFLEQATEVLKPGGRIVCISYHSLEDRLVKRFIKSGNFEGEEIKDFYGNSKNPLINIGKLRVPSVEEIKINSRARSARLRIAEKR